MTFNEQLELLGNQYDVIEIVDLDQWHNLSYESAQAWLDSEVARLHQPAYTDNQRIVFVQQQGDIYVKDNSVGLIIRNLQIIANERDISNFFIVLVSNNPSLEQELVFIKEISRDPVPITGIYINEGEFSAKLIDHHPTSN